MDNFCFEENISEIENIINNIHKIDDEWNKFIKGKPIDRKIVPRVIFESWQRSKAFGIDPFRLEQALLSKENKIEEGVFSSNHQRLLKNHINTILELERFAFKNGFLIQLYDKRAKGGVIGADFDLSDERLENFDIDNSLFFNASESTVGTNAIALALKEKRPIHVLYSHHYNYYLKKACCFSSPIHDDKGEITGVLNIAYNDLKKSKEMAILGIVLSKFCKVAYSINENNNLISYYENELGQIIESLPQGIAYIDNRKTIKYYNQKIIDILKINKTKEIDKEIKKYFSIFNYDKEYRNEEIVLNIKGQEKTISMSNRKILNNINQQKNNLIILDDTKKRFREMAKNEGIYTFDDIIGENERVVTAKTIANQVAQTSVPVLIVGESGTGKELFAQAIHSSSPRKNKPFVAINCGSIPRDLVESELFGYEPGSFTGALRSGKKGIIETAFGGTLFLDEIESMPLYVQIKLLRVLSTKKISKIGGTKEIPVDIRIISATKKDLLKEADYDRFREDLYYRINMFTIELPPLRGRKDDIPILAKHFINKFSKKYSVETLRIDREFLKALSYYYWRGNIRELENVIERAVILAINDKQELTKNHLPTKILKSYMYKRTKEEINTTQSIHNDTNDLLKIAEEVVIEMVLKETDCSLSKAAERLGVSRQTLYNKIYNSEKLMNVKKSYSL